MQTIGKSDIVIKKKEKMNQSSCKQSSFDYHGKDLVLIGKKGTFETKKRAARTGIKVLEDGSKARYCKKCLEIFND